MAAPLAPQTGGARRLPTVLVTGASGYLGRRLVALLEGRAEVLARRIELTDPAAVASAVVGRAPDAVIHAAALNPGGPAERFESVNVGGSANVAAAVAQLGRACRLVHVSTDTVHDGRSGGAPYADDAPPTPINEYGRTKAAAEAAVLSAVPGAIVVRTSLIYGLTDTDRSTEGFVKRLAEGQSLQLFHDVIRQPVWVDALAEALIHLALVERDRAGYLNVAGEEAVSRAELGRRLLSWWRVALPADRVSEVSAVPFADVPLDLRLRLDAARGLGLPLPGLSEVLRRAVNGG